MTVGELYSLVQAACPIQSVDANGNISFAANASASQQQAAQQIVAANIARVNGQPSRIPLDALAIFQVIKPGGSGNLTAAQQALVSAACDAVVLAQNPALAARINQALGLSIPLDQANPNG